jgi:DNA-directed RNA polymerase subunit RPC12/RpoP
MSIPGYQCQQCWATFTDSQCCGEPKDAEVKCPTCQSANVKKVELPESWVDRVRSGLRFG